MKKTVLIGLSGGVDSAVSAYLLLKAGYNVRAVYLENWDDQLNQAFDLMHLNLQTCQQTVDYNDALKVAKTLNISLTKISYIDEYWKQIFLPFLDDLKRGLTPNPDVFCNKYIKFGLLYQHALSLSDVDFFATGHYAAVVDNNLTIPLDKNKDQTYFLHQIDQACLSKIIFPLANYYKKAVREIANINNLLTVANKKDSTGICFIGERSFQVFLKNYLPIKKGFICDYETKKVIGEHDGYYFYTIGQIKQLNLYKTHQRRIVIARDLKQNVLYTVNWEQRHQYTVNRIKIKNLNFLYNKLEFPVQLSARLRYRGKMHFVTLHQQNDEYYVTGDFLITDVVFGQFIVFYLHNICVGGGVISE